MAIPARALLIAVLTLTAAATVAGGLVAAVYVSYGGPLLERLTVSIGEELMKEGLRYEEAGARENAKERYTLALASRFEGPQNRTFVLKRLGVILWQEGDLEGAVGYLREASERPTANINSFEPLCDALYGLGRSEEALAYIERWLAMATAQYDDAEWSAAKFHQGRIALAQDDEETAIEAFRQGNDARPGGRNAAELALLLYNKGRYEEALPILDQYLSSGGVGGRAQYMRQVRARIVDALGR